MFIIQGQVYHITGSFLPAYNNDNQFLQIYFMGSEEKEIDKRCAIFQQIHRSIMHGLQGLLHKTT